jgi:hypothetical protein
MAKTYFSLKSGNFPQDWSDTGLITVNDDWSRFPVSSATLATTWSAARPG